MILRTKKRRLETGERNKLKANKTFGLYVFDDKDASPVTMSLEPFLKEYTQPASAD